MMIKALIAMLVVTEPIELRNLHMQYNQSIHDYLF